MATFRDLSNPDPARESNARRDTQRIVAILGLIFIAASFAVALATGFEHLASTESLGAFAWSVIIPIILLGLGACLLALGVRRLLPGTIGWTVGAGSGPFAFGSGPLFTGLQMVSPATCINPPGSGLLNYCSIPPSVTWLSDTLIAAGVATLVVAAGLLVCTLVSRKRGSNDARTKLDALLIVRKTDLRQIPY